MTDNFCEIHGPYDAHYTSCPFCAMAAGGGRQGFPGQDDEAPTEFGAGGMRAGGGAYGFDDEAETDVGAGRMQGERILDLEEELETDIGEYRRDDITELYPEYAEAGVLGILWVTEGDRRGSQFPVKDGDIVGRRGYDITLDDQRVSNPHAKFRVEDDKFVVWDFGTKNGTWVNGKRIREATVLEENDKVKIGDHVFMLKMLPIYNPNEE